MKYNCGVMTKDGIIYIEQDAARLRLAKKIENLPDDVAELLYNVLGDAADRCMTAGQSGAYNDGGAAFMVHGVETYVHGWLKTTPNEWLEIQDQLRRAKDPEWAQYQRLKKKFEGK